MVSFWSLSDMKSVKASRTLLNILADINGAVVWMFSTRPLIYSSPDTNPLVTVQRIIITNSFTVTFMFQSYINSLAISRYLSFLSLSFNFNFSSAGTAKFTIGKRTRRIFLNNLFILFFFFFSFSILNLFHSYFLWEGHVIILNIFLSKIFAFIFSSWVSDCSIVLGILGSWL